MFQYPLFVVFILLISRAFVSKVLEWRYRRAHNLAIARRVPQSERILGVGQLRQMLQNTKAGRSLQSHFEATEENGPTACAMILGRMFVSTSHPENIKAILATQFKDFDFGERKDAFEPFLGRGIFTADGAHWESSRVSITDTLVIQVTGRTLLVLSNNVQALIRPSFTKSQVAELPTVEEHFQNLIKKIPADSTTVDLQPLFFNFTLDSATHFLFGESVGFQLSPSDSEAERFSTAFDRAQIHLQTRVLAGRFRWLLVNRQFDKDCLLVHRYIDSYVYRMLHRQEKETVEFSGRYNLMSELAEATKDPVQLRNELLNVLLAARDTTASLLSHTFFLIARHKSVWNRLKSEIAELDGRIPTYQDISDMRYVRAVLHESESRPASNNL